MTPIEKDLADTLIGSIVCEQNTAAATYNLPPSFKGFDGHFPNHPILPAVLQIMLGKIVCNALTSKPLTIKSIERAKFMQEISPNMNIQVKAIQKDVSEHGIYHFSVTFEADMGKVTTFSMRCIETPSPNETHNA